MLNNNKWHPQSKPIIQYILEFCKTHTSGPYTEFSKIKIAEIKKTKTGVFPHFFVPLKGLTEYEWLSGSFIEKLELGGTNKYFAISSYCKVIKKYKGRHISRKKSLPATKHSFFFYLKDTPEGYKIVLFKLKK
jgi:hypothetical protein